MESSNLDRQARQILEELKAIKKAYDAISQLVECNPQVSEVSANASEGDSDCGDLEARRSSAADSRYSNASLGSDGVTEELRNEVVVLQGKLDTVSKELDGERSKNIELREDLENASREKMSARRENEDLTQKCDRLTDECEKAKDEIITAKNDIDNLRKEKVELSTQIKKLENDLAEVQESLSSSRNALKVYSEHTSQLSEKLKLPVAADDVRWVEEVVNVVLRYIRRYNRYKDKLKKCETKLEEMIAQRGRVSQDLEKHKRILDSTKEELKQKDADMLRMIFGDVAGERPEVVEFLNRMFMEVKQGVKGAIGLSGRLMALQNCTVKAYPGLLKEIGDAYYSWKPRDGGSVTREEELLVRFLHSQISKSGARNTVKLVECGDRFDASLHASETRGVEVAAVRGWIVLRENGDPIVRAGVLLR